MAKSAPLGQNFLRDAHAARRIVNLLEAPAGPSLEIGAGKGMLSGPLLDKFPGRRVVLVEVDPFLAGELEKRFAGRAEVIAADILGVDLEEVFAGGRAAVIGNLPYHISKPLADWLIAQRRWIGEAVLMLQKDFVDKLLSPAGGKKYNAQSVVFQLFFQARRRFDVLAGAFAPAPKVKSTVITAWPSRAMPIAEADKFYAFVKRCFSERRKTLWNNLAPPAARELLAGLGLSPRTRAEQLPPERFVALFGMLQRSGSGPPQ
jgi:16S rRNA (adenine1518-N6/adenine1519-N6)-dimethyltransferase